MCMYPMYAWRYEYEKKLHFSPAPSEKGEKAVEFFTIQCGKCPECLSHYSYEWSLRIMLEAKYNPPAAFITLTYDDAHAPKDGQLHKDDFQKFMKRFRKALEPRKVRYFACGEYGGKNNRPHFHFIPFGFDFGEDKYFWSNSKHGFPQFRSPLLEKLWTNGFSYISELTPKSALYTAKYLQKLDFRPHAVKPFLLMSNRPGIGYAAIKDISYNTDEVFAQGKRGRIPRYFLKVLERDGLDLSALKENRQLSMQLHKGEKKKLSPKISQLFAKKRLTSEPWRFII